MRFFKKKTVTKVTDCTGLFDRRKIVYIHAADVALPGFTFEGIKVYFDRSLVCDGGAMVVAKGAFEGAAKGYIDYLVFLGIGPDMVIEVDVPKGKNLYEAILASPEAKAKIIELVRERGFRIEFFNTRNGLEEHFVQELGLTWGNVASFPSHVADQGNDKAWIRRLARSLHMEHLFPWHVIIKVPVLLRLFTALLVLTYMRVMAGDQRRFVVKLTNWASGLGQLYTRSKRALFKFFIRNFRQAHQMIVEEDLGPHTSITHIRRFKDGRMEDEWSTVQIIARTPDGVEDLGRVLASNGLPHGLTIEDQRFMRAAHKAFDKALLTQVKAATGVICLDCAVRRDPVSGPSTKSVMKRLGGFFIRRFILLMIRMLRHRGYTLFKANEATHVVLEANVRVTFSDYVRQLMKQVKRILGVNLVCIQFKVRPTSAKSFEDLRTQLGDLMFESARGQGVIPMVPRCLPSGYVYLVAFATDYETARDLAAACAVKLGDDDFAALMHSAN